MKNIIIDVKQCATPRKLHEFLQEAFAFPDYYGKNLDALYDCLTELCEDVTVNVPADIAEDKYLGEYGERLIEVFEVASEENSRIHFNIV